MSGKKPNKFVDDSADHITFGSKTEVSPEESEQQPQTSEVVNQKDSAKSNSSQKVKPSPFRKK